MNKKSKTKRVFVHYIPMGNADPKDAQSIVDLYKSNTTAINELEDVVQIYVPSRMKEGIEILY